MEQLYDPIIEFFEEKELESWKKDAKTQESKVTELRAYLGDWLVKASKNVGGMSMSTHPCTFSHPSSAKNYIFANEGKKQKKLEIKATPITAEAVPAKDGYLRSGNISNIECDSYGNAACSRYFKFLNVKLADGLTILRHIENDTAEARTILSNAAQGTYEEIKAGFLAVKKQNTELSTSSKIKQVYFPVENDYHLLSVLMPSGIMTEMKKRIQKMKFSEEAKAEREKRKSDEFSETGYKDITDLTVVGFGGTKPQNISALNNSNGGKFYFLPSIPPILDKNHVNTPRKSFFRESIWAGTYKDSFLALHKLFTADVNNINIRQGRDNIILWIFDCIIQKIFAIRSVGYGWSSNERCSGLPMYQKIILDDVYADQRQEAEAETMEFLSDTARWLINSYQKTAGKEAVSLADDELRYIKNLIEEQSEVLL